MIERCSRTFVGAVVAALLVVAVAARPAGAQNAPPVAFPDFATVVAGPGAGVTVDVRANDVDPDGDALLVVSVGPATNGLTLINARGEPNYTPNEGFTGVDSFSYTVSDGQGNSAVGLVVVSVTPADPRSCTFHRGTTRCVQVAHRIEVVKRVVTSGCVAGPPPGVPGVRRQTFLDTYLIAEETVTLAHGRHGPVYDESLTTTSTLFHSQLVSSTCEPI